MPCKSDLNCHQGMILFMSQPMCLSTHTAFFFLLINTTCFTTSCLHGNSFLQSQKARTLSLTTDLVAAIQCSYCHSPPQSLTGNRNPASSHCRLQDQVHHWGLGKILPEDKRGTLFQSGIFFHNGTKEFKSFH